MKIKCSIFTILLTVITNNGYAQNWVKIFDYIGSNKSIGLKETNDNKLINVSNYTLNSLCDINITSLNQDGQVNWSKQYDLNSNSCDIAADFIVDRDNNIIVVGACSNNGTFIMKINSSNGNEIFCKYLPNNSQHGSNRINTIRQMPTSISDDYMILGISNYPNTHIIAKLNTNGNIIWGKEFDIGGGNELPYTFSIDIYGDMVIGGHFSNGGTFNHGIAKIDHNNGTLKFIEMLQLSSGTNINGGYDNSTKITGTNYIAYTVVLNGGSDQGKHGVAIFNTQTNKIEQIQLYELNGVSRSLSIDYNKTSNKLILGGGYGVNLNKSFLQIIDFSDLKKTTAYNIKTNIQNQFSIGLISVSSGSNNNIYYGNFSNLYDLILGKSSASDPECFEEINIKTVQTNVVKSQQPSYTFVKNITSSNLNQKNSNFNFSNIVNVCSTTCIATSKRFKLISPKNVDTICRNTNYTINIEAIESEVPSVQFNLFSINGNNTTLIDSGSNKKSYSFNLKNLNDSDNKFMIIGKGFCSFNDTFFFDLFVRPRLQSEWFKEFKVCINEILSIKPNFSGGYQKALSFSWTDSLTGILLGNTDSIKYSPKQSSTLLLNISDNCAEPLLLKSRIWVVPELNNTSLLGLKIGCEPFSTILTIPTSKTSSISTPFLWDFYINNIKQQTINTESSKTESPIPLIFNSNGKYPLLLEQKISPSKTCVTLNDTVTVLPQAIADFQASSYDLIISNPIVFIDNKSIKANQYFWYISDTSNYQTTDIQHQFKRAGSFDVTLIAQNEHNCNDTITKSIKVHNPYSSIIPNSFSPNKDGLNDIWKPRIESLKDAELIIFNRWGEILLKQSGTQIEWDGTYKGEICQEGMYYYHITVKSFEKKAYYYRGFIYLK